MHADINECNSSNACQHTCVNTPGSYMCQCNTGYRLNGDGRTCAGIIGINAQKIALNCSIFILEIDECSDGSHNCEHNCRNTTGSFVCSCFTGYSLTANGFSCMSMYDCKFY